MVSISSRKSLTLDLPPSCIAFCPTQPQYFVVGTYFLHQKEQQAVSANSAEVQDDDTGSATSDAGQVQQQTRSGSLILFRLEGDTITRVGAIATEFAVLDVKWTPHSEILGELLAVATSTGLVVFYRVETTSGKEGLVFFSLKSVTDSSVLVLSLAWHPLRPHIIGLTLSDGRVSLLESTEGELWSEDAVVYLTEIHQHDLEAWTLAFSGPQSMDVLSGGDDVVLQYSHINGLQERAVVWQDRKLHQAGITAILPVTSDLAITGSYDDHIRLISFPTGGRRQVLAEHNLGGGVWQLKALSTSSLPEQEDSGLKIGAPDQASLVILASCMHAGSRVVRLCKGQDGGWQFEVLARFEEHKSMNYASDVQPSGGTAKSIISTSFYDKLLCLWRFDVDNVGSLS